MNPTPLRDHLEAAAEALQRGDNALAEYHEAAALLALLATLTALRETWE